MIAEAIIFDHFFDASASVGGAAAGAEVGRPHTRRVAGSEMQCRILESRIFECRSHERRIEQ